MLKLTYNRKHDRFQTVTVLGDYDGIRDLYWQLTHNYKAVDGTEIGSIVISDLDGNVQINVMTDCSMNPTQLSTLGN
jgi:hypothetical protein